MNDFLITDLPQPKEVFKYFADICSIPHGSGNTTAISNYCVDFAKKNGLKYYRDSVNNVIIYKEALKGCTDAPTVIIQGHLDMVCDKKPGVGFDFEKSGLLLKNDGEFIYADGTTLGADDGIAIAYALAILSDDTLVHPPIEAVFTVDEETGMTGAAELDTSRINGRIMLNIDSEDEGIFTVSCAGGTTLCQNIPVEYVKKSGLVLNIGISGLAGGHSGTEIHRGSGNAIRILGRLLRDLSESFEIGIAELCGGQKDNAIPIEANCRIVIDPEKRLEVADSIKSIESSLKKEFELTDPELCINAEACGEKEENVFSRRTVCSVTCLLTDNPNGVVAMSRDIEGQVQTSVNMGILRTENETVKIHLSVRSSDRLELAETAERIRSLCRQNGGETETNGSYPPWELNRGSRITEICSRVYEGLYKKQPVVTAIHAGLECGIFSEKLRGLDCISFGPDILDIHTYRERMSIASVQRVWVFITEVLRELSGLTE